MNMSPALLATREPQSEEAEKAEQTQETETKQKNRCPQKFIPLRVFGQSFATQAIEINVRTPKNLPTRQKNTAPTGFSEPTAAADIGDR